MNYPSVPHDGGAEAAAMVVEVRDNFARLDLIRSRFRRFTPAGGKAVVLAILVAVPLAAACGGSSKEPPQGTSKFVEVRPSRLQVALGSGTSEYQINLINDGQLSFEEYERAVLAMLKCSEDAGAEVGNSTASGFVAGPRLTSRSRYVYEFKLPAETAATIEPKVRECQSQYSDVIEQIWAEAAAPSQEEVTEAKHALVRCMQDAGVTVGDNPSPEEFHALTTDATSADAYIDCSTKVSDQYDIPGFGG